MKRNYRAFVALLAYIAYDCAYMGAQARGDRAEATSIGVLSVGALTLIAAFVVVAQATQTPMVLVVMFAAAIAVSVAMVIGAFRGMLSQKYRTMTLLRYEAAHAATEPSQR